MGWKGLCEEMALEGDLREGMGRPGEDGTQSIQVAGVVRGEALRVYQQHGDPSDKSSARGGRAVGREVK